METFYQLLPLFEQVGLQLLSGESSSSEGELYLDIQDLTLVWNTPSGNVPDTNPLDGGDLSDWFSLVKDGMDGGVSRVYFPQGENEAVLAFKKSLSQLLSLGEGGRGGVEREVVAGGSQVVRRSSESSQPQGTVRTNKVCACVRVRMICVCVCVRSFVERLSLFQRSEVSLHWTL